jgi:S1-C subfamily serine protease
MLRWKLVVVCAALAAFALPSALRAGDTDKDELRAKILKKVEERLKEENKRVLDEVKKILDEELGKMDEGDEPEVKKPEPKKPEPKKPDPKKPEPKKPEPKNTEEPGYLGVFPEDITDSMRKLLKLDDGEGVLISGLSEEGPAAKAGLKANDIVLAVDGETVGTAEELREQVTAHHAGESVKLSVLRKKEKVDIKVKLASRADIEPQDPGMDEGDEGDEGDEAKEDEKPVKKPKVVFEPRAEAPKFSDKTAEELRDEIRKFLDETLKAEKAEKTEKPKTKKILLPGGNFFIGDDGDEEGEEEPAAPTGKQMREKFKQLLRDMLERMEAEDEAEENGDEEAPLNFDEELKKMMEQFKGMHSEELDKLKEQLQEQMGKLQDSEMLEKLLEGMKGMELPDALKRLLGGAGAEDDENLTEPEKDPAPKEEAPKADPRKGGKAWLGVAPDEVSPEMLKQLKIESGVLVREVIADSPASEAGLKEGDIILSIDGEELASPDDLQRAIGGRKPGAESKLMILRKGKTLEKRIILVARKKISFDAKPAPSMFDTGDDREKKAKKAKKSDKKRKTVKREVEEFNPSKFGMEFAKKQGLRFAVLDKNGKVLMSQPMENLEGMMEMARKFGFEMPGHDGNQDRLFQLFEREDGKKSKKSAKGRGNERAEEMFKKAGGLHERLKKGAESTRKEIEKAMKKFHEQHKGLREKRQEFRFESEPKKGKSKNSPKFKVEKREFRIEPHGKPGKKAKLTPESKQTKPFRVELRKESGKKPSVKLEGAGKLDKATLDRVRKELERAVKEHGGKNAPEELREELKELEKELDKLMKKHRKSMIAA